MFKNGNQEKIDKIKYNLISGSTTKDHSENLSAKNVEKLD